MSNNWTKIYATGNMIEANIILTMLQENDIEAVQINKQDSSYLNFGSIEVYCRPENVIAALHLIQAGPKENEHEK
jgi:type III secretory pathway lipoprotein EscJ